ncbi:MAG: hypothetical protein F4X92_04400 [Gammaproteobacteria bacterium]|nr:hypothetical protein [Gammaproteobacteria bacterium]
MNSKSEGNGARPCCFVGATWKGSDQTGRFVQGGIWENGHPDKHLDTVKSIQVGDRIAIKSAYTKRNDLPFDSRGHSVSVMEIKAIGTVKENFGDGRTLSVDWNPFDSPREWYFSTYRDVITGFMFSASWEKNAFIEFTFDEKPQDFDRFRNAPKWREHFSDSEASTQLDAADTDMQHDDHNSEFPLNQILFGPPELSGILLGSTQIGIEQSIG